MNIYDLLNEIVIVNKYGLSANLFEDTKREQLDTEADKKIFDLCKNISSLKIKVTDRGIEFYPFMRWEGKRTFAIEDLTEDDFNSLQLVDLLKVPLNLRTIIADILWTQKSNYNAACIAANAYFEMFELLFSYEKWVGTLDLIKRAIFISAQIRQQELYEKCCDTIYNHIIRIDGEDIDFLSISLLDILIRQKYGDISVILIIIDKIIKNKNNSVLKVERAYGLKVECYKIQRDTGAIIHTYLELASFYEHQAEEKVNSDAQGVFNAERFLQKAVKLYRDNGAVNEAERVLKRLVEIQREIPKLMMPITTKVDVSKLYENVRANMEGMTFEECVIRIAQMTIFYKRDDIKKELLDEYKEYPLSYLFGANKINDSGQTVLALPPLDVSDPEKDLELLELHIFQKMLQKQIVAGDFVLKYALQYIKDVHEFKEEDLEFLIKDNPIVPSGRERIIKSAIYMFLKGHYYESMHILAPQTENLFRNIAKEVGGLTVTLENDGTSKEKVLSSILNLPEIKDCYDNDILFLFRGLLNERAGANIRNEVAHGLLGEYNASSGVCLYFVCAFIKLLSYTSHQCFNILKTSDKLKTFIEPEETALKLEQVKNSMT